jgi:DNA anti-recombination protein RmuC
MDPQLVTIIVASLVAIGSIITTIIQSKNHYSKELNAFRKSIEEKLNMRFEKDIEDLAKGIDKIENNHLTHIQNDITQLKTDFSDMKNQQSKIDGKIDTILDLIKK